MQSVFIAGSITIKNLPTAFIEKIESLLSANLAVIVGDASGVDSAVQQALYDRGARAVTVYCSGFTPRNNIGKWPVRNIVSAAPEGTKAFFGAKDLAMADAADVGLMLWDAKSTGTLTNVIELTKRGKKTVVFVGKRNGFIIVKDRSTLEHLISMMSDGAKKLAESKIKLSSKLDSVEKQQIGFHF